MGLRTGAGRVQLACAGWLHKSWLAAYSERIMAGLSCWCDCMMPWCYGNRNTMPKIKREIVFSPVRCALMNEIATPVDERAAQAQEVIRLIGEGMLLREACNASGISPQSFGRVLGRLRNLADSYMHAQAVAADLMIDDTIRIADNKTIDPAQARNMMQARQWTASKRARKAYGEHVDITVTQSIDINEVLARANARRLRPVSDQPTPLDVQDVDFTDVVPPAPSDEASPDDIFS